MSVLVIGKVDRISTENKVAIPGTTFLPIKSLWENFLSFKGNLK